jgi:ABC-type Fe3+/spermidine/putrescine transport system ATPase subunit
MEIPTSVLELRNVSKRFGLLTAVDGVSLSVRKGSIISLLGPSGCGKTTLLRIVAGFEQPDDGEVYLASRNMNGKRPYERNVGLLFQDYALFPHMTVEKNVAYGLRQRGVGEIKIKNRTDEMLDLVGMRDFAKRYPQNLSGGQQQRVALGRALANNPELILLDEPLSALDAKLRLELRVELKRILKLAGSTAVVVTHDQEEAMTLGERVIVMDQGQIRQDGTPAQIYDNPETRFVAEFIGRSNWFSGTLGRKIDGLRELLYDERRSLLISEPGPSKFETYDACIRPEHLQVRGRKESISENVAAPINSIEGSVKDVMYLGSELEFIIALECGREIIVIEKNRRQPGRTRGEAVTVTFKPSDVIIIGRPG